MKELVFVLLLLLATAACGLPLATTRSERFVDRSFTVAPGSRVIVKISGGNIKVDQGPAGTADLRLTTTIHSALDRDADAVLADYDVTTDQRDGAITITAARKRNMGAGFWRQDRVQFSAALVVPADVRLELHTSGGAITLMGDRAADVQAHTSGGPIKVDAVHGDARLNTSGGSITVQRALGPLHADTSGGSIRVGYVGPAADDVDLDTSGGSINVGIDPAAGLTVDAATSGGGVSIRDLELHQRSHSHSRINGTLNGGEGRLRAHTSGGSIAISAASR